MQRQEFVFSDLAFSRATAGRLRSVCELHLCDQSLGWSAVPWTSLDWSGLCVNGRRWLCVLMWRAMDSRFFRLMLWKESIREWRVYTRSVLSIAALRFQSALGRWPAMTRVSRPFCGFSFCSLAVSDAFRFSAFRKKNNVFRHGIIPFCCCISSWHEFYSGSASRTLELAAWLFCRIGPQNRSFSRGTW